MNASIPALSGLARRLVSDKLLTEDLARDSLEQSAKEKRPFVQYLVSTETLDAQSIANAASEEFGAPLIDLDAFNIESIPNDTVDQKLIKRHRSLPLFRRGNRLFVAIADPTNLHALDEIKFNTGISTEAVLVEADKLEDAIESFFNRQEESLGDALGGLDEGSLEDLDIEAIDEESADEDSGGPEADEAPIVRFINKILLDAIKTGASDIHFEPYEKSYRVRFRTDGILQEVTRPPANLSSRLAARLKVMSQMDISERRVPQDGRIKMKISKSRAIDFRVNTLPTLFGEKIVLRILDPSSAKLGIDALGYEDNQKQLYLRYQIRQEKPLKKIRLLLKAAC